MTMVGKSRLSGEMMSFSGARLFFAVALGLLLGYLNIPMVITIAEGVSEVFVNLLKMVSLPMIFLSIVSTASGMESVDELKLIGKRVLRYTLLTTVIAATMALGIFVIINPARGALGLESGVGEAGVEVSAGYWRYFLDAIPSSMVQPFVTNNVIGVLFLAIVFSLAILALPKEKKSVLHTFFSSFYAAIMKITGFIVMLMPLGIGAFVTLFIHDVRNGLPMKTLALYLLCVITANIIQGVVVLPLFLRFKGLSPWRHFRGMWPALSIAFFAKSSSAALPMAMQCAEKNLNIDKKISRFSLPLCTTINMNACAAFILTTVLFVSMSHGVVFAPSEMILWIFIATIAAVGNAGVPMGCYFLSSALLAGMNIPLNILGVILPFYTLIDMLESAINVWSDACVTAAVDTKLKAAEGLQEAVLATS